MKEYIPDDSDVIQMWKEDEWWVIRHDPTGVTTQGETRIRAILMLADALAGHQELPLDELQEHADDIFTPDPDQLDQLEQLREE